MDDKSESDETDTIPTLQVRVRAHPPGEDPRQAAASAGERPTDLATQVEHIAARVDRALEHEFEQLVSRPLNAALQQALAGYQKQMRVVLLRELQEQLSEDDDRDEPR